MKSGSSDRFLRRLFIPVHRYLGLFLAVHFILLAITGSILVYRYEVDALLNHDLYDAGPAPHQLRLDAWVQAASAVMPPGHKLYTLMPPNEERPPVYLRSIGSDDRIIEYFLDPETAAVLGKRDYSSTLINQVFQLHAALLLRPYGGADAVGYSGLIMLLMTASGLYLWWPRGQQKLVRALKIKRRLRNLPLLLQWHNLPGAYGAVIFLLVALSGVYLSFPGAFASVTHAILPSQPTAPPVPTVAAYSHSPKAPGLAWHAARAALPGANLVELYLPTTQAESYQFNMRVPLEANSYGANQIYVDPGTGRVTGMRLVKTMSVADRVLSWQPSLHDGAIAGAVGRLVVCLSGLGIAALAITGWLIWLRKRRSQRRANSVTPAR
jgi:uncharacterized iron-regulated membrane protein